MRQFCKDFIEVATALSFNYWLVYPVDKNRTARCPTRFPNDRRHDAASVLFDKSADHAAGLSAVSAEDFRPGGGFCFWQRAAL